MRTGDCSIVLPHNEVRIESIAALVSITDIATDDSLSIYETTHFEANGLTSSADIISASNIWSVKSWPSQ